VASTTVVTPSVSMNDGVHSRYQRPSGDRLVDDFIGVRGVMEPERLEALARRSDARGLAQLASHAGAIAVTVWMMELSWGTWGCVPFFLLQGLLLNYVYAPQHECSHYTAFKSRWINVWVGRLCGFINLYPNDYHRWNHFTHHRHTQDWDKDPELAVRDVFRTPGQYLLELTGWPATWGRFANSWRQALLGKADDWFLTDAQRRQVILASRWQVAGYVAVLASAIFWHSWWPLYFWIGPYLCMRWTYWLEGLGEHTWLTHEPNTLLNTRILKTNQFMRWLNWNMNHHSVHHTFPNVPFFRLPQLYREVEARVGFELPGDPYLKLHWRHLKAMLAGASELDLCAKESERVAGHSIDMKR
jgi:fatty acid desaturase